jgi:hypothetical protein
MRSFFECGCGRFGYPRGTHRGDCVEATSEDKARHARKDAERLEKYHRSVIADLNREAQRADKAVPRRRKQC